MNAQNPNKALRKLRKLQAISLTPSNIAYDCLASVSNKSTFVKNTLNRSYKNLRNHQLEKLNFQPQDPALFTLPADSVENNPDKIKAHLKEYGICVLSDFVDRDLALLANKETTDFLSQHDFLENGEVPLDSQVKKNPNQGENDAFAWQYASARFSGPRTYAQIQELNHPFINVRNNISGADDAGMIDIFHFDQLAKKNKLEGLSRCYQALGEHTINTLIEQFSGYRAVQTNLYYNKGVTSTRGPHLDNNLNQYKIFLYLTDVLDIKHGPYAYVPKSHLNRGWMSKERLINSIQGFSSTEVSSFPKENYTRLLAPAGTAIISCQSGIHGGTPQQKDGQRALILGNYN